MLQETLDRLRSLGRHKAPLLGALAVLAGVVVATPAVAQSILIDSFTTNQAALTLTYPPAGTTASSSISGAGILGGERDLQINLTGGVIAGNTMSATVSSGFFSYSQDATIAGNGVVKWDGTNGSPTVNPTGLGGVDLTAGGAQNAFSLNTFFDDLPVNIVMEVWTDATHASTATFTTPGLLFSSTNFVIPYANFAAAIGTGADFTNVGAITLTVGSTTTAPDLVLDFLQTTSTLSGTKTVAIVNDVNGDGVANPGDTLRYTIVIANTGDAGGAAESGVMFTNPINPNVDLVNGSVTTTQGTVTTGNTAGDGSVAVNIGTIMDGGSVTVTFDVVIHNPLPAGVTQIPCQGVVSSTTLTGLPTDDPTQPGTEDPTIIPVVAAPAITATKAATLFTDNNGNGGVDPGDVIDYTIVLTNTGNEDAAGVVYTNPINPANVTIVPGSATTTVGTVTTGNTAGDTQVVVNVGTIPGGGSVTIHFHVSVNNPLPPGVTQITCQGTVTGTNFTPVPTDNPNTPAPGDPTVTPIVQAGPPIATVPTLSEWGLLALMLALAGLALTRLRRTA